MANDCNYNICNKRLQKIRAYTNLPGEIKTLWNLNKVQITPVIVGAMGPYGNAEEYLTSNWEGAL